MLQNTRVTAFTVSELLREYQQGEVKLSAPPPPTDQLTGPFFFEGKRTWLNHAFKNFKLKCTSGRKQLH